MSQRWGENDKSSRRAIRLRKAWVNRSYRRAVRQAVDAVHEHDDVTDAAQKIRRKEWKKGADLPLAMHVELQLDLVARRHGPGGLRPRRSDGRLGSNHPAPGRISAEALKRLKHTDPQADPYRLG